MKKMVEVIQMVVNLWQREVELIETDLRSQADLKTKDENFKLRNEDELDQDRHRLDRFQDQDRNLGRSIKEGSDEYWEVLVKQLEAKLEQNLNCRSCKN